MTEAKTMKVVRNDREVEMIDDVRKHLAFLTKNLGAVSDTYVDDSYKDELREMVSELRWYCSHGYWEDESKTKTPVSYIFNNICRKNGGVAKLMGIIAGPRLEGWTRFERQSKDMLKACLGRALNYTLPPVFQPQWLLPKSDPKNDHPGAVNYRARRKEFEDESKRLKKVRLEAKYKKKKRLEKESKERLKTTAKQRKDRKKHFDKQNELRGKK